MTVVITALAASILLVGPWSVSRADAKIITATCADARTDAATLNSAISGSKPGSQIVISGHCLLTGPVTLLGDRSYMGGSRTGTVLQQASGANLPYLLASDSYVDNSSTSGDPARARTPSTYKTARAGISTATICTTVTIKEPR